MKYSIIFAATAVAASDAYGAKPAEYPAPTPVKSACYGTVTPGYGKEPVTITKQHQAYPTCVAKGYDGKSCDKWGEDTYVSTTIKDYNGKPVTVTKTDCPVTVYYEKKTITHEGYPTSVAGYPAKPTLDNKGCWYEDYEKIETVKYNKLGKNALKGYPGSGLAADCDNEQEVYVKEYKNSKWNEYKSTHVYGKPTPYVTSYPTPGVYTQPPKDVTIYKSEPYCAETTYKGKAGETHVYGGQYYDAKKTGSATIAYGAYETGVYQGKPTTSKVVKYTTVYVTKTGKVEVCKPTTTVYEKEGDYVYPTASYYKPGVYHYEGKTVTVTKANEPYTCEYKQTKVYETSTKYEDSYGYKASATGYPSQPTGYPVQDSKYPLYNNTNGYAAYPSGSPAKPYANKPYADKPQPYGDKPVYPAASTTPCDEELKGYPTKVPSKPVNNDKYPADKPVYDASYPSGKPVYDNKDKPVYDASYPSGTPVYDASYPSATPVYDASYPSGKPVYDASYPAGTPVYDNKDKPAYPASTPCDDDKTKGYATPAPYPASYPKRDSLAERRKRAL